MSAWTKVREGIISAWYRTLDFDQKISARKREATAKERKKKKAARLASDGVRDRRASLTKEKKAGVRRLMIEEEAEDRQSLIDAKAKTNAEIASGIRPPTYGMLCENCGSIGSPVSRTKGSFWVEVALWLLFCAPGLIYSLWRITSRESVCSTCGGKPIPCASPKGYELWHKYHAKK